MNDGGKPDDPYHKLFDPEQSEGWYTDDYKTIMTGTACECILAEHQPKNPACPMNAAHHKSWQEEDPEGYAHEMLMYTTKELFSELSKIFDPEDTMSQEDFEELQAMGKQSYLEWMGVEEPEIKEPTPAPEVRTKKDTIMMTNLAHGLGADTTKEMADALNLPLNVLMISRILHKSVKEHELWDCRRAPHALFIDCLYLVCKFKKIKVTAREMSAKTKECFGVGTQPRPNEWCKDYAFIVDGVLK